MRLETSYAAECILNSMFQARDKVAQKDRQPCVSTTLNMLYTYLCAYSLAVRKDQKTNHANYGVVQLKWPGLQLALVVGKGAAPNSTANCYFCNPTTTFHTEPTPRQLFLLLYPKPNYSETSLQAPGQPEHIHQARGRRGNLSPLCLFYVLVALA